jgi:antitoxin HicB
MTTATTINEEARQIAARPYTRELVRNEDGTWFARIVEFPGCMTEGDTREEALANLDDAMISWIEVKLEDREAIPEPLVVDKYSGKFLVRVTKSLHRDLARRADSEGVSLNQYVNTALARIV